MCCTMPAAPLFFAFFPLLECLAMSLPMLYSVALFGQHIVPVMLLLLLLLFVFTLLLPRQASRIQKLRAHRLCGCVGGPNSLLGFWGNDTPKKKRNRCELEKNIAAYFWALLPLVPLVKLSPWLLLFLCCQSSQQLLLATATAWAP